MTGLAAQPERVYRILIIDDNDGDILLLRQALRSAGLTCEFVAFTDGEDALRHLSETTASHDEQKPDAVLLDMHLPKLEGTTILAAMRSNRYLLNTPVVVLSSAISSADRERVKQYNVARHLVKPCDLDEFLGIGETVREVLMEYQSRQGERGEP